MKHHVTLDRLEAAFRTHVCASCPYRTPGLDHGPCDRARPCEDDCELFQLLPTLYHTARNLDPMVGRRHHVLTEMLIDATRVAHEGALKVREHGPKTVQTVEQLFYPD